MVDLQTADSAKSGSRPSIGHAHATPNIFGPGTRDVYIRQRGFAMILQ